MALRPLESESSLMWLELRAEAMRGGVRVVSADRWPE